jgi:hypothetical protein
MRREEERRGEGYYEERGRDARRGEQKRREGR